MGIFSTDITGIDIGAGAVKVVRVSSGRRPRLVYAGMAEASLEPDKRSLVSADIRYLLSTHKGAPKRVFTVMPGTQLTIRFIVLPKMPRQELKEAIRWEARRHISYPLDAAKVEYLILGDRREGAIEQYEILMVAAERGGVVEFLVPFNEAGVKVAAVDANPLALRNLHFPRGRKHVGNTMIVDMGAGKTEIDIFKDGGLRLSRCLDTGGFAMTRAVAEQLGIGLVDAEEMKRKVDVLNPADADPVVSAVRAGLDEILLEIKRSVEYYKTTFREKAVERVVLTGGVSLMTGIKEYFSVQLQGSVELDNPFSLLACKDRILQELGHAAPRFSSVVGLALRKA